MSRLKEIYKKVVIPRMKELSGYRNNLAVPKLEKVTVNVGVNIAAAKKDPRLIEFFKNTLIKVTGQKPVETKAKKSISGFKMRKGEIVGLKVTLRGNKMYDFIDKLIQIILPRTRDFFGLSENLLDKQGNFSLGIREQHIFPEISAEATEKIHGLEVTITTTAKTKEESLSLLKSFGFPFKKSH